MSGLSNITVRLCRDSFNTPWGFRLQGGKDVKQPLTVQRVFSNSPAEGELQRGDIIISINNRDTSKLTHKQAQDGIKFGGGQIDLVIHRPPPGRVHIIPIKTSYSSPTKAPQISSTTKTYSTSQTIIPVLATKPQPKPQFQPKSNPQMPPPIAGHQPRKVTLNKYGGGTSSFGSDYTKPRGFGSQQQQSSSHGPPAPPPGQMMYRVQESLDTIIQSPTRDPVTFFSQPYQQQTSQPAPYSPGPPEEEEEDFEFVPVKDRKKTFQGPPPVIPGVKPVKISRGKPSRSYAARPGPQFGTDYTKRPAQRPIQPPAAAPKPVQSAPPPFRPQPQQDTNYTPAWKQSLQSGSSLKPWEQEGGPYVPPAQLQQQEEQNRSVPSQRQSYSSAPAPAAGAGDDQDGPQVVHLQYNSPMGLYSNANIEETLHGQIENVAPAPAAPQPPPEQAQGGVGLPGGRDWSQSAVFQAIQSTDGGRRAPYQKPKPGPPAAQPARPAPKQTYRPPPQPVQSYSQPTYDDEMGISDF